jgi:hypothetical protein
METEEGTVHSGDAIRIFKKYAILESFAFFGLSVSSLCKVS